MRRFFKLLCCMTLLFTLSFSLSGCSENQSNETDTMEDTDNTNDDELAKIDSKVEERFNGDYAVSQEDVSESVTYINENIDNIKDKDVAKNIYEHSLFLETAATQGNVDDSNKIKELAVNSKEYAKNVYNASDDEVDNIIEEGKEKFDTFKNDFKNGVDSFVDEFMKFF